jgi:hypothetical protein
MLSINFLGASQLPVSKYKSALPDCLLCAEVAVDYEYAVTLFASDEQFFPSEQNFADESRPLRLVSELALHKISEFLSSSSLKFWSMNCFTSIRNESTVFLYTLWI